MTKKIACVVAKSGENQIPWVRLELVCIYFDSRLFDTPVSYIWIYLESQARLQQKWTAESYIFALLKVTSTIQSPSGPNMFSKRKSQHCCCRGEQRAEGSIGNLPIVTKTFPIRSIFLSNHCTCRQRTGTVVTGGVISFMRSQWFSKISLEYSLSTCM